MPWRKTAVKPAILLTLRAIRRFWRHKKRSKKAGSESFRLFYLLERR